VAETPSDEPPALHDYVQCSSCFALVEVTRGAGVCPACGAPVGDEQPKPEEAPVSRKDLLSGLLRSRVRRDG
jgi:hypothetical protein